VPSEKAEMQFAWQTTVVTRTVKIFE